MPDQPAAFFHRNNNARCPFLLMSELWPKKVLPTGDLRDSHFMMVISDGQSDWLYMPHHDVAVVVIFVKCWIVSPEQCSTIALTDDGGRDMYVLSNIVDVRTLFARPNQPNLTNQHICGWCLRFICVYGLVKEVPCTTYLYIFIFTDFLSQPNSFSLNSC